MLAASLIRIEPGSVPVAYIALDGEITDQTSLDETLAQVQIPPDASLDFDCARVRYINSVGVKQWVLLFEAHRLKGTRLSFGNCPPSVVNQISILPNFILLEELRSLLLPYLCPGCNAEALIESTPGELMPKRGGAFKMPEPLCSKCGSGLVFDENPNEYLPFLGPARRT